MKDDGVISNSVKDYAKDRFQDACWLCQSKAYGDNVRELEKACLNGDGKAITDAITGMGVFIGMNPIKGLVRDKSEEV
ncbi:hypothetical protein HNV12_02695 [Methanococcoides sp. SA1]|nr:hypothetical protein [Methanococcoides sp. SA1]